MPIPRAQLASAKPTKPQTITQWSYSRLRDWKRCGKYAYFKHVLKMKEPGNQAMERGGNIHTMAQAYVEAPKSPRKIAEELATFEAEFKDLRKLGTKCEAEWAFTTSWAPTGWFSDDCWCRVKMDAHYFDPVENMVTVIDHKTGKVAHPGSFVDQEELYALGALLMYPDCEAVRVMFWYLDAGVIGSTGRGHDGVIKANPQEEFQARGAIYTRADVAALKKKWNKEVRPMMLDTRFLEKPTANCRYCHFSKTKGGPCVKG